MNLRGKVKSLRDYSYKGIDKFGEISKGERQFEEGFVRYPNNPPAGGYLAFNTEGNFDETIEYDIKENIEFKVVYSYNEKGRITEKKVNHSNNTLKYKYVFKYDNNGYLIDESIYLKDGSLSKKKVYDNQEERNKIFVNTFFVKGELSSSAEFEYNDEGYLIKEVFNDYGVSVVRHNYYYNNKGYLIKRNQKITSENRDMDFDNNFNYNENGDMIESGYTSYKYEYDSQNNWIKRIEFNGGFPEFIVERKIEYYK